MFSTLSVIGAGVAPWLPVYTAHSKCNPDPNHVVVPVVVVVVVVVVEIFVHGAVKATVTNALQSQLNK